MAQDEQVDQSPTLAAVAEDLYAATLEDFTGARDARVKELRVAGHRDLAREVAALRRPTTAAWAVNQLVRARPEEVEQLLALGAALRDAQEAFAGEELRELNRQQHRVVAAIREEARAVAARAGRRLSETVGRQVEVTLRAGMADPAAAEAVRSGLLTSDLESTGFDPVDLEGAVAVPGADRPPRTRTAAAAATRTAPAPPTGTAAAPRTRTGAAPRRPDAAVETERFEQERLEQERLEQERLEQERLEEDRRREQRAREVAEARARLDRAAAAQHAAEDRLTAAETAVAGLARRREDLATRLAELHAALEAAQADDDAAARELAAAGDERAAAADGADAARQAADLARAALERLGT